MSEWLQRHADCPQCRQDYLKTDAEIDEEEKDDGDDDAGVAGSTTITFARNSASTRPETGGISRSRSSGADLEDVDLERGGGHNAAPAANDLELPQWYRETIPGIGLRYSAAASRRSS